MQIRSVMTSYGLQLKSGKYWINDISGNIKAVFLKLGTANVHQKRNKMTPLVLLPWQQFCCWCCVNKNCNSQFCFKIRTIYPTQSNDGTKDNMGTISVPSRTLCPIVEVANGDFFAFWQKETGAKRVDMETALRVSFCFFFDVHLWCQVSRTLLQYFQRYRLFSIFHLLVANNMTSSLIKFA